MCDRPGYSFNHHHALEDAKAAAHVLLSAMAETTFDLDGILRRASQHISGLPSDRMKLDGNPEGPLAGEVVAFTGALEMPRAAAARLAADLGCDVAPSVSRRTTLLVVGDVDVRLLAGHGRSAKHRKAEELISQGISIRIIFKSGFKKLIALDSDWHYEPAIGGITESNAALECFAFPFAGAPWHALPMPLDPQLFLTFLVAAWVLILTPGPDILIAGAEAAPHRAFSPGAMAGRAGGAAVPRPPPAAAGGGRPG